MVQNQRKSDELFCFEMNEQVLRKILQTYDYDWVLVDILDIGCTANCFGPIRIILMAFESQMTMSEFSLMELDMGFRA